MPPGKSSPALFELLANQRGAAAPAPRAAVEVKPIPSAPESPHAVDPQASDEPQRREGLAWTVDRKRPLIFDPGRVVSLPIGAMYVIGALLFAGMVIGWSVSYKKGRADEQKEWRAQVGAADPMLKLEEPPTDGHVPLSRSSQPPEQPVPTPAPATRPEPQPGEMREPGNNYLHVATLERGETERLIAFLAENGITAMGALDTTKPSANNQPRFWVFTLHPIPSGQYTSLSRERKAHEAEVARLGKIWKQDHGGTTDLSGTLWRLYKP